MMGDAVGSTMRDDDIVEAVAQHGIYGMVVHDDDLNDGLWLTTILPLLNGPLGARIVAEEDDVEEGCVVFSLTLTEWAKRLAHKPEEEVRQLLEGVPSSVSPFPPVPDVASERRPLALQEQPR